MSINKISSKNNKIHIYVVNELDGELKLLIRKHLQNICFGEKRSRRNSSIYSYQQAIKSFLAKYDKYHVRHKTGTVGELLCHIIVRKDLVSFAHTSRLFNLEENSVKKGFDVVLYHKHENKVWITEVKSSQDGSSEPQKLLKNLIKKASEDLNTRLNSGSSQLWENAVNHAEVVLTETKLKNTILDILDDLYRKTAIKKKLLQNVILAGVSFQNSDKQLTSADFESLFEEIKDKKIFNDLIVLSIHKKVFNKIEEFLRQEVGDVDL